MCQREGEKEIREKSSFKKGIIIKAKRIEKKRFKDAMKLIKARRKIEWNEKEWQRES